MGIADDINLEHRLVADTLESLGPDAPGGVGDWSVEDLAAHLRSQWAARGAPVFGGRYLIGKGYRLGDRAGQTSQRTISAYRRRGFRNNLAVIRIGVPKAFLRPSVAPVSLFEVWVHHDDVRRANGLEPPAEPASLGEAVDFALLYQAKPLGGHQPDRSVSNADLLRWLAGRPSSIPAHDPPLRF